MIINRKLINEFGCNIEISDCKNRMTVGTHQADECTADLRIGSVFDVEDSVEDTVYGKQNTCFADKTVRNTHIIPALQEILYL